MITENKRLLKVFFCKSFNFYFVFVGVEMIRDDIESKLASRFSPHVLQVINESHRHNVPEGSESHFKVIIVSDEFNDKRSVSRHREVYQTLTHEMDNGVHALALHTFTLNEWDEQQDKALRSPGCRGGSQED